MAKRVTFSEADAGRISKTVRAYERGNRDQSPVMFRQVGDDVGVRLGTISATWIKGSTATVTEQNGDGSAISGNPTFTATNHFATVTVTTGTKRVACMLIGSTWVLTAAEC